MDLRAEIRKWIEAIERWLSRIHLLAWIVGIIGGAVTFAGGWVSIPAVLAAIALPVFVVDRLLAIRDRSERRGERPGSEQRFISAYEALHYMVDVSAWGRRVRTETDPQGFRQVPMIAAAGEFMQRCAEDRVRSFGRENGAGLHQPIPAAYWLSGMMDLPILFYQQRCQTVPRPGLEGVPLYTELQASEADVHAAWPSPSYARRGAGRPADVA